MQRKAVAVQAAQMASLFLQKAFRTMRTGKEKADGTFVSAADHGSDARILRTLKKAFPHDAILSEESGALPGQSGYRWIIDPLDGTHNFLADIPLFGILIALEKAGSIVLSVCAFPMLGDIFVAEKGKGATRNGKRIRISADKKLDGNIFLGDGNTLANFDDIVDDLRPLRARKCKLRLLGEAAFGASRVACGSVPAAIIRSTQIWDIAAPCFLVEEAGGTVTDFQGKRWDLHPRPFLLSNGAVHRSALSLLKNS
jgi:myo-inositol-1(or 4)-monophosphatase